MTAPTGQTQRTPDRAHLDRTARDLTRVAGTLAAYCEHVEHNEPHDLKMVVDAAQQLRALGVDLASRSGHRLVDLYLQRLQQVEEGSVHSRSAIPGVANLPGVDALLGATTWDEVQFAQLLHDRQFHPDVVGMSKLDQLRHYTFHVTKLAGMLVDVVDDDTWNQFRHNRVADIAIFGVKLATVCNESLSAEPADA